MSNLKTPLQQPPTWQSVVHDSSNKQIAACDSSAVAAAIIRRCNAFDGLLAACKALPGFDIENPDAAEFRDHASQFMRAMRLAREAIAAAEKTK